MGEQGPEMAFLPTGSQVLTAGETKRAMGSSVQINFSPVVHGNLDSAAAASLREDLQALGDSLVAASRQGYIRWDKLGITSSVY